jgi:hypothetical protein
VFAVRLVGGAGAPLLLVLLAAAGVEAVTAEGKADFLALAVGLLLWPMLLLLLLLRRLVVLPLLLSAGPCCGLPVPLLGLPLPRPSCDRVVAVLLLLPLPRTPLPATGDEGCAPLVPDAS